MERSIVSIVILSFLITSTAAVKKLPEHLFVNRAQEKTHSVEKNRVETQVTTVKVFWSLYEGGYVYQKKKKREEDYGCDDSSKRSRLVSSDNNTSDAFESIMGNSSRKVATGCMPHIQIIF